MIKGFADKQTAQRYTDGTSKRLPPDVVKRALRRLEYIELSTSLDDLKVPPQQPAARLKR